MSKQLKRGRKPERFSILSQEFLKKGKQIKCKPKPFADDITKTFIRKLSKKPSFRPELTEILKNLDSCQKSRKLSSNQRAKVIIDALSTRPDLMIQLKMKYLSQLAWDIELEQCLKINYAGKRYKKAACKELIDEIFRYIGLEDNSQDEEIVFLDDLERFTAESSEKVRPLMDLEEVLEEVRLEADRFKGSFKVNEECVNIDEVLREFID